MRQIVAEAPRTLDSKTVNKTICQDTLYIKRELLARGVRAKLKEILPAYHRFTVHIINSYRSRKLPDCCGWSSIMKDPQLGEPLTLVLNGESYRQKLKSKVANISATLKYDNFRADRLPK